MGSWELQIRFVNTSECVICHDCTESNDTFRAQVGFRLKLAMCYRAIWDEFGILPSGDAYGMSKEQGANSAKLTCFVPWVL